MYRVFEQAIFERRLQVLKSVRAKSRRPTGRAEMAVGHPEGDCECLGDPLGKLARNIALLEGRIIAGLEGRDRRD